MHSALLSNNKIVTADDYDDKIHGVQINCIDKGCKVPVFFIKSTEHQVSHFKTSGKGNSVHNAGCGFAKKLTFQESVAKVGEYQADLKGHGLKEQVIRLNLNDIDPDYVPVARNTEPDEEKEPTKDKVDLKEKPLTPQSISSLSAVKKLFTSIEPDLLANIIISVKGMRLPISELIRTQQEAHRAFWNGETLEVPYFIHGKIDKVIRLKKVCYISFTVVEDTSFSLILFQRYFKHFTLTDDKLVGKDILAYGMLKSNEFNKDKPSTEMIIKSERYIEFL